MLSINIPSWVRFCSLYLSWICLFHFSCWVYWHKVVPNTIFLFMSQWSSPFHFWYWWFALAIFFLFKNWSTVDLQCCGFFLISLARVHWLYYSKESAFGLLTFSRVYLFSPVLISSLYYFLPSIFLGEGVICYPFLVS